jgi:ubiquinone/menaquinone biosynthesis C-methylase UbiE
MLHSLLRHIHGGGDHSHADTAPQTTGTLIHWAKRYDFVVQFMAFGQARRLRRKSIAAAQIRPGDCILDVGCGTGDLTLLAKERAGSTGQVYGIDAAPEMIDVARRKAARAKAEVDFRVAVIERLPFPAESFDVVLSSLMMHHLPADLKPQALAELRRVVKPGGRLLIVDFKGQLEKQGVAALVKSAGFARIETGNLWLNTIGFVRAA